MTVVPVSLSLSDLSLVQITSGYLRVWPRFKSGSCCSRACRGSSGLATVHESFQAEEERPLRRGVGDTPWVLLLEPYTWPSRCYSPRPTPPPSSLLLDHSARVLELLSLQCHRKPKRAAEA